VTHSDETFGTQVASHSATSGDKLQVFIESAGNRTVLGEFFAPDDNDGSNGVDYWTSLDFDYSISGGVATVNYSVTGLRGEDGTQYANNFDISGSTNILVDSALGGDQSTYVAVVGSTAGKINTPNSSIDNIRMGAVSEPSAALLGGIAGLIMGFRRRR